MSPGISSLEQPTSVPIAQITRQNRPTCVYWHETIKKLFERKNGALLQFLAAHLRSAHDAREVAQETYEWLMRHQDDPRVQSWHDPLELLLFGVAKGIAKNRLSCRMTRDRIQRQILSAEDTLYGQVPTPDQVCVMREEIAIIRQSLDELTPRCRQIFILARLNGLSVEDVAEQLNMSPRTVWRHIARAVEHCRRRLDEADRAPSRKCKERPGDPDIQGVSAARANTVALGGDQPSGKPFESEVKVAKGGSRRRLSNDHERPS